MKRSIEKIISIGLIFTLAGCTTTSSLRTGAIDSSDIKSQAVFITNIKAEKSRNSLYVSGRLVNHSGYAITDVVVEAKGYDKNNNLVSTDKVEIAPNTVRNSDHVDFSMIFVKNVDQIQTYHFFGKYDFIHKSIKVDWKTLGTIFRVAGTILVIAGQAYSQSQMLTTQQNQIIPIYGFNQNGQPYRATVTPDYQSPYSYKSPYLTDHNTYTIKDNMGNTYKMRQNYQSPYSVSPRTYTIEKQ